jgi:hypothetical protein
MAIVALVTAAACQPTVPRIPSPVAAPGSNVTARGTVLSVERPTPEDSQSFVHVTITPSDRNPVRLVLAPGWYLDEQGLRFEPRESISVEGRAVVEQGQRKIVVQRVQRGEHSYLLRDEHERPLWLKP